MHQILTRLLREPLLHFFLIAGLIYLIGARADGPTSPENDLIVIDEARVVQLSRQFNSVWQRQPDAGELDHLIAEYIREEVYYRDALALGLDRNDAIVRQRLRQKLEFLSDTSAQLLEPTGQELQEYYTQHSARYQRDAKRAFEQVYLGQAPSSASAEAALARLIAHPDMDVSMLAERTMLPAELRLELPEGIDSVYGRGFFEQIREFPVGVWSGPVISSYGTHLVRVLDIQATELRPLVEVRELVVRDWRTDKAIEVRELDYQTRRARFDVQIVLPETAEADTP